MASVTKNEIPEIAQFMSEYWELVKKYYIPEDTDAYWNALNKEQQELVTKHKNDKLVVSTLCALTNYLEAKMKGEKKNVG